MDLKTAVRSIPDFPKPGILFRDVTTLFQDPEAFRQLIDELAKGLVLARKPGKLPCESLRYEYALEYGTDSLEIHVGAIKPGQKVVVVDDLLATGGTCLATAKLVEEMGGEVVGARFAIELASECGGRDNLKGYDVYSAIVY